MNQPDSPAAPLVGAWVQVRVAAPPGQEQRNFADAATDAQGITYIVAQASNSTALVLTRKRGDVLLDEVQYPLPDGYRGSGYGLSSAGEVYGYGHKTAADPLWEFVLRIPGFVPISGGGGPPPDPGPPAGDYITRVQAQEMIDAAVGAVPAAVVAAVVDGMNHGGTPYNHALEQFFIAMFSRHLPPGLITTANMGQAYADSPQIMQQLDNRVYATLLKHHIIEAAYKVLGLSWPPPPQP